MPGRDVIEQLGSGPVILPSLLLCDFANLQHEVEQLQQAGIRGLHLDVMDGQFVPNLTYGMPIVDALRKTTEMPLDVFLFSGSQISSFRQPFNIVPVALVGGNAARRGVGPGDVPIFFEAGHLHSYGGGAYR